MIFAHRRINRLLNKIGFWHIILCISIGLPLWNEFLSYLCARLLYPSLSWSNTEELRILFVADPQLLGNENEDPTWGAITRWDSDRYLSKTFGLAYGYVSPDVVIFMGDLLDEGSTAKDIDYETYFQRFQRIFAVDSSTKTIYISGDNDVGGEGDPKTDSKVKRFEKHFGESQEIITMGPVDFIKLDYGFSEWLKEGMLDRMKAQREQCESKYRILLNHVSLLEKDRADFQPVVDIFSPTFAFSAHDHEAVLYTCVDCREETEMRSNRMFMGGKVSIDTSEVYTFNLKNVRVSFNEIALPTCSYRMGVPYMGYGAAILKNPDTLIYATLWGPSRYFQLYCYGFGAFIVVMLLFSKFVITMASHMNLVR